MPIAARRCARTTPRTSAPNADGIGVMPGFGRWNASTSASAAARLSPSAWPSSTEMAVGRERRVRDPGAESHADGRNRPGATTAEANPADGDTDPLRRSTSPWPTSRLGFCCRPAICAGKLWSARPVRSLIWRRRPGARRGCGSGGAAAAKGRARRWSNGSCSTPPATRTGTGA